MQTNQTIIHTASNVKAVSFPSAESFVNIFLCMFILASVTIFLSILIKKESINIMERLNK